MTNGFFNSTGNAFVACTPDQIYVYNCYDQEKWELTFKKKMDLIEKDIYDVDLNPDGEKQLAVTCQNGQSYLVDLENSRNRVTDLRLSNA